MSNERINLELAKFEYEWLRGSTAQLALKFDLPLVVLETAVASDEWLRRDTKDLVTPEEIDKCAESLKAEARLRALQQDAYLLSNQYIRIKIAAMERIEEMIEDESVTPAQMGVLVKAFNNVLASSPIHAVSVVAQESTTDIKGKNIQVIIQSEYKGGNGGSPGEPVNKMLN